jgi:hypothetical protein
MVKPGDDATDGNLFRWRNRSKLNPKRIGSGMVDYFAV